ncbi:MAG TPA: DUF4397 domain-containing protein [Acidobacteriaceae bacterium]|jgi:hypothetical protein
MNLYRLHLATRTGRLAALALLATALAGCQSMAGTQQISQVRVIDVSPDAPALDIYQNTPPQTAPAGLYNIGFGTVSSYMPVTPGSYNPAAFTAGTQQQLAAIRGSFATNGQYTVLAGNIAANLQMTVLKDQSTPAPAGQTAFRFLGQATRSGAVDIYLLPPGFSFSGAAPIATGVGFGTNTGYINAPSGTYSIFAFPTGAIPSATTPAYTGHQVSYPGTSVRTILFIDQPPATSGLQTITAADYDPTAS